MGGDIFAYEWNIVKEVKKCYLYKYKKKPLDESDWKVETIIGIVRHIGPAQECLVRSVPAYFTAFQPLTRKRVKYRFYTERR